MDELLDAFWVKLGNNQRPVLPNDFSHAFKRDGFVTFDVHFDDVYSRLIPEQFIKCNSLYIIIIRTFQRMDKAICGMTTQLQQTTSVGNRILKDDDVIESILGNTAVEKLYILVIGLKAEYFTVLCHRGCQEHKPSNVAANIQENVIWAQNVLDDLGNMIFVGLILGNTCGV